MRRKSFFTILELVVVIVIISVMTAVAAPKLSGFYNFSRLRTSARELSGLISSARNKAMTEKRRYCLIWKKEEHCFFLKSQSLQASDEDKYERPGDGDGFIRIPQSVDVEVYFNNRSRLVIDPAAPAGKAAVVFAARNGDSVRVRINPGSGRPQIIEGGSDEKK